MKRNIFRLGLLTAVIIVATSACGFSFTTANIAEARMAKDPEGNQPTETFTPQDTFYVVVDLDNAPEDTVIRSEWTAVDVEGAEPNTSIDSAELTTGSGQLHFKLENNSPWPPGEYQVELFIDDESRETLDFQVEG